MRRRIEQPEGKFLDGAAWLQLKEAKGDVDLGNAFSEGLVRAAEVVCCGGREDPGWIEDEGQGWCVKGEQGVTDRKAKSAAGTNIRRNLGLPFAAWA